jgi:multicomponent Na+:H+ antiporter subunit F
VNVWLLAAIGLLLALVPCFILCMRGDALNRLVGLETAGTISVLLLVVLAEALQRDFLYDMALAQALLTFGGGLIYARFLERWL